ncbi:MAG: hypothetical protein JW929_11055 [Anaerolineales bacterium]|nr:hypothetical protein [Anaerolineales bacterium]
MMETCGLGTADRIILRHIENKEGFPFMQALTLWKYDLEVPKVELDFYPQYLCRAFRNIDLLPYKNSTLNLVGTLVLLKNANPDDFLSLFWESHWPIQPVGQTLLLAPSTWCGRKTQAHSIEENFGCQFYEVENPDLFRPEDVIGGLQRYGIYLIENGAFTFQ